MKAVAKFKTVFSLPSADLLLLAEAVVYLAWARLLISIPFSRVSPSLGIPMVETSEAVYWEGDDQIRRVSSFLHKASRHVFWECKCLVRAIVAVKMLARRGIDSTLYLGTAKGDGGEIIAHAWVRCGSLVVTGAEEMKRFTVVGKFAKFANQSKQEGAYHG